MKVNGRRKMIYVPSDWEETIRSWVQTGKEADGRIDEVSRSCLDKFLEETGRSL
jgi:hypothetical protein